MRISDWSSDVCSSDLASADLQGLWGGVPQDWIDNVLYAGAAQALQAAIEHRARADATIATGLTNDFNNYRRPHIDVNADADAHMAMLTFKDRKSVVSGTSVSVRVDLGGRRIIKKNNNQ